MKRLGIVQSVRNIFSVSAFLKRLGVNPLLFLVPIVLGLAATTAEGISALLLLPMSKGVLVGNFTFLKETKYFHYAWAAFPRFFDSYMTVFNALLISVFFCVVAKAVLQYASRVVFARQMRGFSDKLRREIFDRYLSFGKLFFDRANIGHLSNVLLGFTNTIAYYAVDLQNLANGILTFTLYLGIMFWISWKLAVFSLLIFPLFNYSIKWIIEKIKGSSMAHADYLNALSERSYGILSCMPLVKAYDRENEEKREFSGISDNVRRVELSMDKSLMLMTPLQDIIMFIPIALLISYIALTMINAKPSEISRLVLFFFAFKKASNYYGVFGSFSGELASLKGPFTKIAKIFNDDDKFFVVSGQKIFEGLRHTIEISGLDFSYHDERKALKSLDLVVEKGKVTAIVGETGAGKTTLVNILMRFYDCSSCSIRVDGTDIREFDAASLRSHMAMVSQDTLLFNDTIRRNLAYGLEVGPSDEQIFEALKKARLYDFVMSLPSGLQTYVGDRGVRLSGGEKQRVAIARALLKDTEIIMLDEATSSLDSITERLIQEAIDEIIKGKTVIVIAHRLSTIKNADKIAVMEHGAVIEEGTLQELLDKKGKFYKYWEHQKFF